MATTASIDTVCCYGSGLIGSGWAAHFLRAGLSVRCFDPRPEAAGYLEDYIDRAWPTLERLGLGTGASRANLSFTTDAAAALNGVQFVQESAVEEEAQKIEILAAIDRHLPADVIIASSSSGFLAERLRAKCRHGGRVVIGHPFNPPFLVPLVEVVGGTGVAADAVARASAFYRRVGSHPVELKSEITGYIGNRLQMAVWREVMHMVEAGVASVADIDDAMTYGPALRWALAGPSHIFYLGARNPELYPKFIELLVHELATGFVAPPEFQVTPQLVERYVAEVRATWGDTDPDELRATRDGGLVALSEALARLRGKERGS